MAREIIFLKLQHIIQVISHGELSMEESYETLCEVIRVANKEQVDFILWDAQEVERIPNSVEMFQILTELPDNFIIAIISPTVVRAEKTEIMSRVFDIQSELETFQKMGRSFGLQIEIFYTLDKGLWWLSEKHGKSKNTIKSNFRVNT